jgi:hypothetical protein
MPQKDGTFSFDFNQDLLDTIVIYANQLGEGLGLDSPDLTRLFPTAYADDPEKDAGFQIFSRDQLIEGRREAIETMQRSARSDFLSFDELNAWMRTCNDLRLVLGTRLEISEDDAEELPPSDPNAAMMDLYRVLGYVVSEIVEALMGAHNRDLGAPEQS